MHMFGFEPRTQARIVDFRLALPEIWRQSALDPEMIQLQFDGGHILRKIPPYIICTDEQSGESLAFTLRFDDHIAPALERGMSLSLRSQVTGKPPADGGRHVQGPTMEHIDLESQSGILLLLALSSTQSS